MPSRGSHDRLYKGLVAIFCLATAPLVYVTGQALLEKPATDSTRGDSDQAMQEVANRMTQADARLVADSQIAGHLASLHPLAALRQPGSDLNPAPVRSLTAGLEAKALFDARKIVLTFLKANGASSASRLDELQKLETALKNTESPLGIGAFRTSISVLARDVQKNADNARTYDEAVRAYAEKNYEDALKSLQSLSQSTLDAAWSKRVKRLQYLAGFRGCLAHWPKDPDVLRDATRRKALYDEFDSAAKAFEGLPPGLEEDQELASEATDLKSQLQDKLRLVRARIELNDFFAIYSPNWRGATPAGIGARIGKASDLLDKYPMHPFVHDALALDADTWLRTVCKPKPETGFGRFQEARYIESGAKHGTWERGIWDVQSAGISYSYRPSASDATESRYVQGYSIQPRQIESERLTIKYNSQLNGLNDHDAWKTKTAWSELVNTCAALEHDLENYRKAGGDPGDLSFADERKAAQAILDSWAAIEALRQKLRM